MKKIVGICLVLCCLCVFMTVERTLAVNYDVKIEDAERDEKDFNQRTQEIQKDIEEIEESREDTLAYIEKLDKKTEDVEERLLEVNNGIARTEKDLGKAEEDLEEITALRKKQYDTMKQRIKYMYENGNHAYVEILLGAGSIPDLLNRTEYIEKISAYDRNIFSSYQETVEKAEQKQNDIEGHLTELTKMKQEAVAEKNALSDLRTRKKEEMKHYDEKLKKAQDIASEYARQAAIAEAEVERLLEAKQDEIDRQNASGSGNSDDMNGDGKLRWPLAVKGRISSGFGPRSAPTAGASSYHRGLDIAVSSGTPILAAGDGKVVTATYSSSAGNYLMIYHGKRLYTVYMHCSRLAARVGDTVRRGQVIAYVGSTGISTGPHLHFGVSKNGSYVNPLTFVR